MDRNKIINAMEAKTTEIFNANEKYKSKGKHGMMVAQLRSEEYPDRWDSTILAYGKTHGDPAMQDGYPISTGFSMDTTVHEKIAYVRRTGKSSGAPFYDVIGNESYWKGAVISDDGKCICAFSGFEGEDDVLIAEAGIAVYEQLK
jgi:hypothetical protein